MLILRRSEFRYHTALALIEEGRQFQIVSVFFPSPGQEQISIAPYWRRVLVITADHATFELNESK